MPDAVKITEVAMVAKAAPAAALTTLETIQKRMDAPWCKKNKWTQRDCGNGTLQKNPYREKMCQEALAKKCIKEIKWKELSNPVLNQLLNIPGVQVYEGKKTDTKKLGGGGRPCRDGRQCRGIPRDGRRSKYQCRAPRYKFSPNGKRTGKQCRKRLSGGARKKSRSRKKKSRSRKKKSRSRKKKSRSRKKKSRSRKKKSRSRKKKSRSRKKKSRSRKKKSRSRKKKSRSRKKKSRRKSRSRKKKSRRKSRKKKSRRKSRRKRSRKRSRRAKGFIGDMRKNKSEDYVGLAAFGLGGGRRRR